MPQFINFLNPDTIASSLHSANDKSFVFGVYFFMKNYTEREVCLVCAVDFKIPLSRKGKAKYCSRKCMGVAMKEPCPIGERFSRLVVVKEVEREVQFAKGKPTYLRKVECLCDCGKSTITRLNMLHNQETRSCGCLKSEQDAINLHERTHGLSNHFLYPVWINMITRCYKQKCEHYKNYGGRGISVCEQWLDCRNFIFDMVGTFKEGMELERVNNNGDYEPSNCIWETTEVQANNKRNTIRVIYNGEEMPIHFACRKANVEYVRMYRLVKIRGLSFEAALKIY